MEVFGLAEVGRSSGYLHEVEGEMLGKVRILESGAFIVQKGHTCYVCWGYLKSAL